tara:strand:+ start:221 stop:490 length:270 start_codon:yes stop_codon:yes gene_type:complete
MTDKSETEITTVPPKPVKTFKKGALVRVRREAYMNSLESQASDLTPPEYIFEGPGELLSVKGEYCQIRWRLPVPDVWLRTDQLEDWRDN